MTDFIPDSRQFTAPDFDSVARMIEIVGGDRFQSRLLSYLHTRFGAEHCAILRFSSDRPVKIAAVSLDGTNTAARQIDLYLNNYWRYDPTMIEASHVRDEEHANLMRLDVDSLPPSGLRDLIYRKHHISERLLLCGSAAGAVVGLSILRSDESGKFTDSQISELNGVARLLLSLVGKHADLVTRQSELSLAVTSLPLILECMASAPENLSRREVEVCARILYGMSSIGIALELDIGEETVKTYRKRAYQRLGIATQRELLVWYIERWSEQRMCVH